jgi:hypothetical protein
VLVSLLALTGAWVGLMGGSSEAAPSPVRFASPTVVNNFVPGFEPDVAVDSTHLASRDRIYASWPNGFSTTISYFARSDDHGASFHPVAGSVGGKLATCVGGGDSELQVSRKDGQILFADLQGLTNFSTGSSADGGDTFLTSCFAVTGLGVDRQWIAIDDNAGTSSIGPGADDGRAYLVYDNIFQATGDNFAGNQPVINASSDGVNYGGCVDPGAIECKGPAAVFSDQDDIVGNVFIDANPASPRYHAIDEVRGDNGSDRVLFSTCRGAPTGTPTTAAATAAACTNPLDVDPSDSARVNRKWSDHVVAEVPENYTVKSFAVGAIDTVGNVYVTWAQYKLNRGAYASTGQVMLAHSTDGGLTWSKPRQLNAVSQPTVIFPWITAGDPGRVDVVWYGAPQPDSHGHMGPDALSDGTWDVTLAQSIDALDDHPSYTLTRVSDHHVKWSGISTGGFGGSADRSLGDFLQVRTGNDGEAIVSYVDDTSGNRNVDLAPGTGQDPVQAAGPTMFARQIAGPSLFASKESVGNGTPAVGGVTDPTGVGQPDAYLATAGLNTDATPALDISEVSISQPDSGHLQVVLRTADPQLAQHLTPNPTMGGAWANWRVRWAGRYGSSGPDGQIWYVGLQGGPDGAPEFYVGKTASIDNDHTKYFAYPTGTSVPGRIEEGIISWTVPLSAIGNPEPGDGLFSVTGFVSTSAVPDRPPLTSLPTGTGQAGDYDSLTANLIDAAPSFSYTLGARPGVGGNGSGGNQGRGPGGGHLAATGVSWQLPLLGLALLGLAVTGRRLRRS